MMKRPAINLNFEIKNNITHVVSASEAADNMLKLMGKTHFETTQLPLLYGMGFKLMPELLFPSDNNNKRKDEHVVIKMRCGYLNGKPRIGSLSREADCLFRLMERLEIESSELPLLYDLGFKLEVVGKIKELSAHLEEEGQEHTLKDGVLRI